MPEPPLLPVAVHMRVTEFVEKVLTARSVIAAGVDAEGGFTAL